MSGRSLTEVLEQLDAHERPIVQSLSFDALRKWVRSHELIKQFIPKTPPPEVDHLLSVAIALFLQEPTEGKGYPAHTIVDQAVKACGEYDPTMYAKGLVNAVLRKVSLTVEPLPGEKSYPPDPIPMFVPAWWRANLKRHYSKDWQSILFAGDAASRRPAGSARPWREAGKRDGGLAATRPRGLALAAQASIQAADRGVLQPALLQLQGHPQQRPRRSRSPRPMWRALREKEGPG